MRFFNKKNIIIALILGAAAFCDAQDNTMFLMDEVPGTIQLNPAIGYRCKNYILLPILSSIKFSFNSTSLGYNNIFSLSPNNGSASYRYDLDQVAANLKKRNYIMSRLSFPVFGMGFEWENYYLHFEINNYTRVRMGFPGDLTALKDGNWDLADNRAKTLDLSGIGGMAINYTSIGLGISTEVNKGTRLGARVEYLRGAANFTSRRARLHLTTTGNPITLESSANLQYAMSFPMQVGLNNDGYISSYDFSPAGSNIIQNYLFNKNWGFAIDLGFVKKIDQHVTFSGSLLDIGFIRWGSNTNKLQSEGEYYYEGIDLEDYRQNPGEMHYLSELRDTITKVFRLTHGEKPYYDFLPLQSFIGMEYAFTSSLNGGIVLNNQFFDNRLHTSATIQLIYRHEDKVSISLSNTYMNNQIINPGFGLVLGKSPIQFFFITDRLPIQYARDTNTGIIVPLKSRSFNFNFGISICLGCDEKFRGKRRSTRIKYCPAYN